MQSLATRPGWGWRLAGSPAWRAEPSSPDLMAMRPRWMRAETVAALRVCQTRACGWGLSAADRERMLARVTRARARADRLRDAFLAARGSMPGSQ